MPAPVHVTPTSCEDRAVGMLDALAVEDETVAKAWADPESRLLLLHVRLGVAAVFDALQQASAGQ